MTESIKIGFFFHLWDVLLMGELYEFMLPILSSKKNFPVFSISFLCALLLSFDICFIIWLHIALLCFIFHSIFLH